MTDQPGTLDRLREAVERAEKAVVAPLSDAGPYFTRAAQLGVVVQAEQSVRIADALVRIADALDSVLDGDGPGFGEAIRTVAR